MLKQVQNFLFDEFFRSVTLVNFSWSMNWSIGILLCFFEGFCQVDEKFFAEASDVNHIQRIQTSGA